MRLSKEMIRQIAGDIGSSLQSKNLVKFLASPDAVAGKIADCIAEDLSAEDRLDDEVKKILASHDAEIAKGGMDYRKIFEMTKRKIADERGIVL